MVGQVARCADGDGVDAAGQPVGVGTVGFRGDRVNRGRIRDNLDQGILQRTTRPVTGDGARQFTPGRIGLYRHRHRIVYIGLGLGVVGKDAQHSGVIARLIRLAGVKAHHHRQDIARCHRAADRAVGQPGHICLGEEVHCAADDLLPVGWASNVVKVGGYVDGPVVIAVNGHACRVAALELENARSFPHHRKVVGVGIGINIECQASHHVFTDKYVYVGVVGYIVSLQIGVVEGITVPPVAQVVVGDKERSSRIKISQEQRLAGPRKAARAGGPGVEDGLICQQLI